ncbi:juxtaposed with another zinc finger protein 1 [Eudromia elegans]
MTHQPRHLAGLTWLQPPPAPRLAPGTTSTLHLPPCPRMPRDTSPPFQSSGRRGSTPGLLSSLVFNYDLQAEEYQKAAVVHSVLPPPGAVAVPGAPPAARGQPSCYGAALVPPPSCGCRVSPHPAQPSPARPSPPLLPPPPPPPAPTPARALALPAARAVPLAPSPASPRPAAGRAGTAGRSPCNTMTGIAAASFFSNACRFGGCGLHFPTLAELIEHIEDNHIDTDPRVLEKQELQQPTYVALSYINRFMTDAARREQESLKKKIQPKLSLTLSSTVSRGNVSTPPRHSSGSLTPPVTPPITPSSSFRSSTPTGSEYDEEEVDYEESDSDESWTTESAISSEAILSSMCMNGGDEKPFACPVPGCKKRYKNVNGIKYHAKNGHRTQIRVRKPFKCRCGKSYKTAQGLRHHTINFHPPVSAEIIRKMQQ